MKKLLFIALISILFIGCKKDAAKNNASSILGTWNFLTETTNTYTNGSISNTNTETFSNYTITFNSNNQGSYSDNGVSNNFTYYLSGTDITLDVSGSSGTSMTTGILKTLTSSKLEIYRDYSTTTGESFDDVYSK